MIAVEPIEKILKCGIASGKLEDERPLSLIFIAKIECGKTEILRKHCLKSKNVFYTTDATAHGITQDTNQLRDFASGRLSHIVIPDLLAVIGRKATTVRTFMHFMNSLIEEGVVNISTYAAHLRGNVEAKAGFITAIPPGPFFDKRHKWAEIGFLSRALPVTFDYKLTTRIKILSFIKKQKHLKREIEKLNLPKKPKKIKLPLKMAKKIEPYAMALASEHSQYGKVYGFRYQKQLQTLAKAIALLDGKDKVDKQCIKELARLANFINFDFNRI